MASNNNQPVPVRDFFSGPVNDSPHEASESISSHGISEFTRGDKAQLKRFWQIFVSEIAQDEVLPSNGLA